MISNFTIVTNLSTIYIVKLKQVNLGYGLAQSFCGSISVVWWVNVRERRRKSFSFKGKKPSFFKVVSFHLLETFI